MKKQHLLKIVLINIFVVAFAFTSKSQVTTYATLAEYQTAVANALNWCTINPPDAEEICEVVDEGEVEIGDTEWICGTEDYCSTVESTTVVDELIGGELYEVTTITEVYQGKHDKKKKKRKIHKKKKIRKY